MSNSRKLGVLFSGGKDSCLAMHLAQKEGYEIGCLISLFSENKESFMFHTPMIEMTEKQAELMGKPLIIEKTIGTKEEELVDLSRVIKKAIRDYGITGIVTGAVLSVYQSSRVQKICNELNIYCFNPLWQRDGIELLEELVRENFEVMIVGIGAYPLDENFLGRIIDSDFVSESKLLNEKYGISPIGEGGEFESLVVNCPLFRDGLNLKKFNKVMTGENSGFLEVSSE
jgi:diphthine-ammonia ligase